MNRSSISHYRILKKLGAGGMGEVYLAEDSKLDRKVAIKFLTPEAVADEKAKSRLIREARAAAKLDHPNICSIYEVDERDGQSFIVMLYVEGETLATRMLRQPLELKEFLDVSTQVADALAEAHSRAIIHRDIKPANIMISPRGQVKVMDFGLAKLVEQQTTDGEAMTQSILTEPGTIVGTVPYMSPEQVRGEPVDARSDIFSFGTVLYEMVSGRQPFASESAAATLSAILTREPPPLARYSKEVPAELERIVSKAVCKDREKRYQVVKDLALDLRSLREELEFVAKLERSRSPELGTPVATTQDQVVVETADQPTVQTSHLAAPAKSSIIAEVKRHKVPVSLAIAALAITVAAIAYLTGGRNETAIDSLAVLPFINFSADSNTEYLADGITDSLISNLSQLSNLKVMSRNSVYRYKDPEMDPQAVGRELKVQAVLAGRIVQRGDSLTISLELVDARDNRQLWGEQYHRQLSDALAVQREISREVSERLRLRLSGEEQHQLATHQTENSEAYQLYLRGRFHYNKTTEEAVRKGIDYFHQALDKDPAYALAYVGLADSYIYLGTDPLPPKDAFPQAKAYAEKALALNPALAEAHGAMGLVKLLYEWDWAGAERELQPALGLNPKSVETFSCYLHYKDSVGQPDQAVIDVKQALEKDPLSTFISGEVGCASYYARLYDQSIEQSRATLELDPNYVLASYNLARGYGQKAMYREAIAELNKGRAGTGDAPSMIIAELGYVHAVSGNKAEAHKLLGKLREQAARKYVDPYLFAILYTGLGEKDRAFAWLDKAYEVRSTWIPWLRVEPKFDSLRSDPRFGDLLRRVGLENH